MAPAPAFDEHLNNIVVSFVDGPKQSQLAILISEIGIGAQLNQSRNNVRVAIEGRPE